MFLSRIIAKNPLKHILNVSRYLSTQNVIQPQLKVAPQIILSNNWWIYQQNDKIITPIPTATINLPDYVRWVPPLEDPITNKIIEDPSSVKESPKEAARLIVIRRKKMKKHKLRKLRKRMKFEWRKLKQKRELRKEKAFQAVLIQQCKDAESFSAEKYVEERINRYKSIFSENEKQISNVKKTNI